MTSLWKRYLCRSKNKNGAHNVPEVYQHKDEDNTARDEISGYNVVVDQSYH